MPLAHHVHFTPEERRDRAVFLGLLDALSHPGRLVIPEVTPDHLDTFERIGLSLLDLETRFFTTNPRWIDTFQRAGARLEPIERAEYLFFDQLDETSMGLLETVRRGTPDFPEDGATLFVAARLDQGPKLTLSGPGIPHAASLKVDRLPTWFWSLRANRLAYPLGWDLFLIDGDRLVGLPRTTQVNLDPLPSTPGG